MPFVQLIQAPQQNSPIEQNHVSPVEDIPEINCWRKTQYHLAAKQIPE